MRKIHSNVPVLFVPEEWTVTEYGFNKERSLPNETVFSVGNGYLGVRGYFEEGVPSGVTCEQSLLINGVYEYHPYRHIWQRPGFPGRYHSIFSQVNALALKVYADGELCTPFESAENYMRRLDLKNGVMKREYDFITSANKRLHISLQRFACQNDVHVLMHRVEISSDEKISVRIETPLCLPARADGIRKEEIGGDNAVRLHLLSLSRKDNARSIDYRAEVSAFRVACALEERALGLSLQKEDMADLFVNVFSGETGKGVLTLERAASFYTDSDCDEPLSAAKKSAAAAIGKGFGGCLAESETLWQKFWDNADLQIEGDLMVQQGVRFSLFMLQISAGKDGKTNIGANGLTGTGYMGHTFWDTEIFMTPAFLYSSPEVAKQLLLYRYNILPNAEKRAAEMDDVGALYSWNSINGEECGHVFEAATAQYHLNCDIFYAIKRYYLATDDWQFMKDYGIEMLAKTSKCLSHRGNFIDHKGGKFCINGICGPDEYNPVVNNNLYTNWLTRDQFYFTLQMLEKLRAEDESAYLRMLNICDCDENELARWKRAEDNMYIAYDETLDLYLQDDDFLDKDPIDVDAIPPEKLPLLTHLHPLNLWRYQVIKQADIVLLIYLYSHEFTREMKRKIFDFYEPKTIHDSSLSAGIHCIVAQDIGYAAEAYGYLKQAARMDLDDVNRNTFNGVHSACQGSAYMMIVNGFAGMRDYGGKLHFKPAIPEGWQKYSFKIAYRGRRLRVTVEKEKTQILLSEGEPMEVEINGRAVMLSKDEPYCCRTED